MELDFKTIKALSSPTRIQIMNKVMEKECTPTEISNELGKSKSTVSSHLETLIKAELVEKDSEEGRRRVIYEPTDKACDIVNGKERKVKFSVVSSALTLVLGIGSLISVLPFSSVQEDELDSSGDFDAMTEQEVPEVEEEAGQFLFEELAVTEMGLIVFGLLMISLGFASLLYSYLLRKLE